jgi:hypothetical protein
VVAELAIIAKERAEMKLTQEALKFLLLYAAYWAYMVWFAQRVPEQSALLINGVLVPFLVGSVGYLIFRGSNLVRVILATGVSLLAALIVSGGGDPAKPGAHLVVIAVTTAISCLGAVATAGVVVALQTLRAQQKLHKH